MSAAPPRDWDAHTYDRVSTPQVEWALRVLDRLALAGDETVLDAGCGTGRVTQLLLERLPRGRVIAVDSAPSMVERARAALPADRVEVLKADLTALTLSAAADAVFSNAVFHWITDHEALFARLHQALRPGGRLIAQCGGAGNIDGFLRLADEAARRTPGAEGLAGWRGPWRFATAEETAPLLEAAGFDEVRTWLEPHPVTPPEPENFIRTVCLGHHLERLDPPVRDRYVGAVAERLGERPVLDYVRLNIDARRPA